MHKLFIIIPVHNRINYTRRCLNCLREQTFKNFNIILIDDGSSDGTAEILANNFPEVHLIKGDGNLWWTGAVNLALNQVLTKAEERDYILTINNDTVFDKNYVENLVYSSEKQPDSIIGSIALDSKSNRILDGGIKLNLISAKFSSINEGKEYSINRISNRWVKINFLSGRGLLIPVKVIKKIGLFDDIALPHYGADYEFTYRAKKNGFNLFIDYLAVVYNDVSVSGINNSFQKIEWIELLESFFSIRSKHCIKYRFRFAKAVNSKFYFPIFFLFDISRVLFSALKKQIFNKLY